MTSEAIRIERVRSLDDAWADLWRLFQGIVAYHEPLTGERLQPDAQAAWRRQLEGTGALVLVARDEAGRAVGFATAERRSNPALGVALGMLDNVYVEEPYRRRGIGRLLVAEVEAWCRELGLVRLDLNVRAVNVDGIAAWRAMGFVDESLRMRKDLGPAVERAPGERE